MTKNKPQASQLVKWLQAILLAGGIVLFLRSFIFIPINVTGNSMSPTLEPDTYVIYEPFRTVDRFDVVLFHDGQGESYIKRVVGLPGDSITYREDELYINDGKVDEPYLNQLRHSDQVLTPDFTLHAVTGLMAIPEDSYFVLGDNRPRSKDSRMFGFVPKDAVEGKIRFVIYPFSELAKLP